MLNAVLGLVFRSYCLAKIEESSMSAVSEAFQTIFFGLICRKSVQVFLVIAHLEYESASDPPGSNLYIAG